MKKLQNFTFPFPSLLPAELRDSGLKIKEIAEKTGLSERHIKHLLEEDEEIDKMSKGTVSKFV